VEVMEKYVQLFLLIYDKEIISKMVFSFERNILLLGIYEDS
jgi:hypothetical protein